MAGFEELGVRPCDILLPREDIDLSAFAVVACDQFTSDRAYWDNVASAAAGKPSALELIFPEIDLDKGDDEARIRAINAAMDNYLADGVFRTVKNAILYVERTLSSGELRQGLVLACDLEKYDYSPASRSLIRATEGTIEDRLPPRVKIRRNAPLELPHIMILINDAEKRVIEPLASAEKTKLYDTPLMLGGGHITGWALSEKAKSQVLEALYTVDCGEGDNVIRFAMGDGNHSLATAKKCWEALKPTLTEAERQTHPARFALCELVNLHAPSMVFRPIHRVLFHVDKKAFLREMNEAIGAPCGQQFRVLLGQEEQLFTAKPSHYLPVGTLQRFLDEYLACHSGAQIDYVHEEEQVRALARREDAVGLLVPGIDKADLFPAVRQNGALPRKTFSMGEGKDKRYYLEARKIR